MRRRLLRPPLCVGDAWESEPPGRRDIPWNKLGYGLELDAQGRLGDLTIDFDDLARLLSALDEKARARGLRVQRVIVAPEYVPLLLASPSGRKLGALSAAIVRGQVWWRHDEHVHIDFALRAPR